MSNTLDKIIKVLAAAGGAAVSFFVGVPPVVWILLIVMSLDYLTGLACGALGKSSKTETGGLSSKAAFAGLLKKSLILAVVALAALLDWAVSSSAGISFAAVTGATCLWFIASEGVSITENAAELGVPIPGIVKQMLEAFRKAGDEKSGGDAE